MQEMFKRRLEYDFSRLLNELYFIYEQFFDDTVDTHEVTSLLHNVFRLWGVCAEHTFKLLLLQNQQSIYTAVGGRCGVAKTISCKNAFAKCQQQQILKISESSTRVVADLINLRNCSQHLAIDFSDNLAELLYKSVKGIDILATIAQSELDLILVNRSEISEYDHDGAFNLLCNEVKNGPSINLKVLSHKSMGGVVKHCYECKTTAILIPLKGDRAQCISCGLKIEFAPCSIRNCENRSWSEETAVHNLCDDHIRELLNKISVPPL